MVGIKPAEFWDLTPWQFRCCLEAYGEMTEHRHNREVWLAWHQVAFARCKKMPDLKTLLSKKEMKGIDEAAIIARLKAYQQRVDNDNRS
jgi:hypothetical protein